MCLKTFTPAYYVSLNMGTIGGGKCLRITWMKGLVLGCEHGVRDTERISLPVLFFVFCFSSKVSVQNRMRATLRLKYTSKSEDLWSFEFLR